MHSGPWDAEVDPGPKTLEDVFSAENYTFTAEAANTEELEAITDPTTMDGTQAHAAYRAANPAEIAAAEAEEARAEAEAEAKAIDDEARAEAAQAHAVERAITDSVAALRDDPESLSYIMLKKAMLAVGIPKVRSASAQAVALHDIVALVIGTQLAPPWATLTLIGKPGLAGRNAKPLREVCVTALAEPGTYRAYIDSHATAHRAF